MDSEDPGWRPVFHRLWYLLIPRVERFLLHRDQKRGKVDQLTALRIMYVGQGVWLLPIAVVLLVISPSRWFTAGHPAWFVFLVLGPGALLFSCIRLLRSGELDVTSPQRLAGTYRAQTFICLGVSEAPALLGFVGTFVMSTFWIYLVGLAFALTGLLLAAPTPRELARRQERLSAGGSNLSLVRALMQTPAPGWKWPRRSGS